MSVLRLIPQKGEAIALDADEALVGREAGCNVVVPHPSVSRRHALIKRKQGVFFVVDQGSANGTFVDSKRIVDAAVREGSVVRFGSASFRAEIRDELPVVSVAEDELIVSETMVGQVGQQSFSATVLEGAPLPDDAVTSRSGTDHRQAPQESAPTPRSPVHSPPQASESWPERPKAQAVLASPPLPPTVPNRGPAFWLMIGVGALALLLMGAALGLGAAFLARRMGWL